MLSDFELMTLLSEVKKGNHKAYADLSAIYKPLVESYCRKYSSFIEREDLRQICSLALYNAACSYDIEHKSVTFGAYASVCMRNAVTQELRKTEPATDELVDGGEEQIGIKQGTLTPEEELIAREGYDELTDKIRESLSAYELRIFGMYLSGKKYSEMAKAVGKSEKSVGTAISRAKIKLQGIIKG